MNLRYFIPRPDLQFLDWLKRLIAYVQAKMNVWGIPSQAISELQTLMNTFQNALAQTENPATRTPVTVRAKNEAREALESKLRLFLKAYVTYNPAVTNPDREAMELPIHKTTRDHSPVATTFPWILVIINLVRHLQFDFRGSEASKAKPAGQHGMELVGQIGGEKPADQFEMPLSYFDTNSPLKVEFKEEDRGKTFWFAARWENTRGEKGPWSDIMSAIIP
jgi:hypothetical protein